jgi:glycine cleavage system regulatory protein
MLSTVVMTVIGPDRPGLVQIVAARVADHGGNWLESRMCHLGGQFAGILRVEVAVSRREELEQALRELERDDLRVIIHTEPGQTPGAARQPAGILAKVGVVGQDRPGILRSVSGVLAAHGINVEELSSERVSVPMGGGILFQVRALVLLPPAVSLEMIRAELEKLDLDLMVDVAAAAEPPR